VEQRAAPIVLAVLGSTGTGKSALALSLAEEFGGEIVSCDSVAVYRGFDIGADKTPVGERRGIPHHLIDVADPLDEYTAARYGSDAAAAIRGIEARGRLPIVVGGTGFYFRALTRGLFPGPARDAALRVRLGAVAARRGPECLHRTLARIDPSSAQRIQPRDTIRLVRALEVYRLTGRPLSEHFSETVSPLGPRTFVKIGLSLSGEELTLRIRRRVYRQFARGLVAEIRSLIASGVPETVRAFSALGYRQALEFLRGVRDEPATKELIAAETRRYARRQLIWFRKEPNLVWIAGAGESPTTVGEASRLVRDRLARRGGGSRGGS
jgi:tRNA dimethylallyltransferase